MNTYVQRINMIVFAKQWCNFNSTVTETEQSLCMNTFKLHIFLETLCFFLLKRHWECYKEYFMHKRVVGFNIGWGLIVH